jgi:hypothetical protein
MQDRFLGRVEPDMDVCDINGDKLGTVARVYRFEATMAGSANAALGTADATGTTPPREAAEFGGSPNPELSGREDIIEIKTGFLGLGKHLYVPMSAVQDATQGCVFLHSSKDEVEAAGWDEKPPFLDKMS